MFVFPLLIPCALFAQERLTLADAVAQGLRNNPQMVAAAARVEVADGLRRQAGLSPNPRLFLQSENARFWGSPSPSYPGVDTYAFVGQTIETAGKAAAAHRPGNRERSQQRTGTAASAATNHQPG